MPLSCFLNTALTALSSLTTFFSIDVKSSTDKDNTNEEKILKIFGKMMPLMEELDKPLLDVTYAKRIDTVAGKNHFIPNVLKSIQIHGECN